MSYCMTVAVRPSTTRAGALLCYSPANKSTFFQERRCGQGSSCRCHRLLLALVRRLLLLSLLLLHELPLLLDLLLGHLRRLLGVDLLDIARTLGGSGKKLRRAVASIVRRLRVRAALDEEVDHIKVRELVRPPERTATILAAQVDHTRLAEDPRGQLLEVALVAEVPDESRLLGVGVRDRLGRDRSGVGDLEGSGLRKQAERRASQCEQNRKLPSRTESPAATCTDVLFILDLVLIRLLLLLLLRWRNLKERRHKNSTVSARLKDIRTASF